MAIEGECSNGPRWGGLVSGASNEVETKRIRKREERRGGGGRGGWSLLFFLLFLLVP